MGLVSDAAAMARGRAGAIFLTAALAILPAYFLAGGIVFLAAAHASAQTEGGATQADAAAARGRELPPDAPAEARRDVLREASGPAAPRLPPVSLVLAAGILVASLVMMGALFLAQAALLQVAAGASRPAAAWAAVAARFPALSGTAAAALALIALGLVACALPGLFVAFAFSLAGAVAVAEGISGFPALQRSWELIKRAWPEQLALILGTAALVVVLTQGLGRLLADRAVLAHGLLDAAVAAAVLPLPVFASAVLYLRERSAAEGKPVDELRQYIRRTSEPG
jgi:hypothetical protein